MSHDDPTVDLVLLARLQGGADDALAVLYDRHGAAAYGLAVRLTASAEMAEEVVQEAFLALWRRSETYRADRGTVRSWLLTVVRNRAIDAIRARDGRPRSGPALPRPVALDDVILVASDDPEAEALRAVEGEVVRGALAELPREQREVVQMAYFGGLTYPEVAAATGIPLGTVKSRMRLALERLRILVGQRLSA